MIVIMIAHYIGGENTHKRSRMTHNKLRWCTLEDDPTSRKKTIANKVLSYFAIKPRLQRSFRSSKNAYNM